MQNIDELIYANKGLVYKQLHRFNLVHDPDAESAGFWALHKAIVTYNETAHTLLSTYATCCIYNALGDYYRKIHRKQQLDIISYDTLRDDGSSFEECLTDGVTTEEVCVRKECVDITRKAVVEILEKTKGKQRDIIQLYVDSEYLMSPTDIAKEIGVSQSYVSQALSEFRFKVKKKMEGYYRA